MIRVLVRLSTNLPVNLLRDMNNAEPTTDAIEWTMNALQQLQSQHRIHYSAQM